MRGIVTSIIIIITSITTGCAKVSIYLWVFILATFCCNIRQRSQFDKWADTQSTIISWSIFVHYSSEDFRKRRSLSNEDLLSTAAEVTWMEFLLFEMDRVIHCTGSWIHTPNRGWEEIVWSWEKIQLLIHNFCTSFEAILPFHNNQIEIMLAHLWCN